MTVYRFRALLWAFLLSGVVVSAQLSPTVPPSSGASFSDSAGLAALLSDETGSGKAVFQTSPILVTPTLGVASATSVTLSSGLQFTDSTNVINFGGGLLGVTVANANILDMNDTRLRLNMTGKAIYFGNDLIITRDAANTLAQRNSTTAQAFRVYNTWTDASNGEWATLNFASNILHLGATNNGTGTARVFQIDYGGTTTAAMSIPITSGDVTFGGVIAPTGYKSSDGTAGASTTCTIVGLTSFVVKNGLVVSCS